VATGGIKNAILALIADFYQIFLISKTIFPDEGILLLFLALLFRIFF